MSMVAQPSPLALTALAFVRGVETPSDLAARFVTVDAVIAERTAQALLDELRGLGLARLVPRRGGGRYATTHLGERLLNASFVGHRDHADLLAELEEMRTDLLSTIAHEMRTPLTAVRTSVGLLLDPAIEASADQRVALLRTIDRNATRMQRVVGDILDLSRFRAGGVQLQLRRFDAIELARAAIASIAPLVESRHQRIEFQAPSRPAWVFGDYRRLEQALVNLLSNAGKYSPAGSPIHVAVATIGSEISWMVRDVGPGIKPEDRLRLFERFFVARNGRSEATGGVGLGLPITLAIVQAHDGRVEVQTEPGDGSTFSIIIPATGPDGAQE